MSLVITLNQLKQFAPKIQESTLSQTVEALNTCLTRYSITDTRRIQYFMTQVAVETQGFTKYVENLVYTTPQRLVDVWPSRFTMSTTELSKAYAPHYIKNETLLASLVYANREGNGNAESGDGYKYRGRGAFHLTFKNNYKNASLAIHNDDRYVTNPDLVANLDDAFLTAGWFWDVNKFNALADADAFTKLVTILNGSAQTVPTRLAVLAIAKSIFK